MQIVIQGVILNTTSLKEMKHLSDEEFKGRMRKALWVNGYSSEQIERMMKRTDTKDIDQGVPGSVNAFILSRPTYVKVHRKHLDPETLDVYGLPWEWDDVQLAGMVTGFC